MNTIKTILFLLICVYSSVCAADDRDYAVSNIKPELLKHANAVVRDYSMELELLSLKEVVIKEHYVITILNDKADGYANFTEGFSKLSNIESASGCIYDAVGARVLKIKASDFKDMPSFPGYFEFSDSKVKRYNVNYHKYPYTVEYTTETRQPQTFFLPGWSPLPGVDCALEAASLKVIAGNNIAFRYKGHVADPQVTQSNNKQFSWSVSDVAAQKREPMSCKDVHGLPEVLLAMDDFMLGDMTGNMSDWKGLGQFIYNLNRGRDILPEDIKAKVQQMTAGVTDDRQKIKILYAYLQHTMRYVALEYGIGGWQTLDAAFLAKNEYGDCKALSNFMMALLETAGIRAYPVIIHAGEDNGNKLIKDFVSHQSNHEILCVPFAKDTTWLECTSSDLPAAYLSDFTQDRDALMITPSGGVLVHTPKYDTSVNFVSRHGSIACRSDGTLGISVSGTYKGEPGEMLHTRLKTFNDHDKQEYLLHKFRMASYSVDDYQYQRVEASPVTCVAEQAKLTATGMQSATGSRRFVSMDVCPVRPEIPDEVEDRKTSFYIPESMAVCDTFEMELPATFDVEFIPAPVSLSYPFGSYSCSITRKANSLVLIRTVSFHSGVYEAASFANYIKLLSAVNNEAQKKVVLNAAKPPVKG